MDDFDEIPDEVLRQRRSLKWHHYAAGTLPFWIAEMDLPTAAPIVAAVADAVGREEWGYPLADADTGVPEALAGWCASRYGWTVEPARVHLVPDVLRGVELCIDHFSPPGAPVVVPTPAYMPFLALPEVVGRPVVEVPCRRLEGSPAEGRAGLDLDGIDAALGAGAGTVLLCQPHNPLGRVYGAEELRGLARVVADRRARVVSDEIHGPLTYPGTPHVPYASVNEEAAGHSLTVVAATKAWNFPGLKCAQVVTTNDADERRWQSLSPLRTHGSSTLGIRASVAAYREGGPWLEAALTHLDRNRHLLAELLAAHLPEVGYRPPQGTYLAWLDLRRCGLEREPAEVLLERGRVATVAGPACGEVGGGHVRFNFATSASLVEQAVTAMATAVRAERSAALRPPRASG